MNKHEIPEEQTGAAQSARYSFATVPGLVTAGDFLAITLAGGLSYIFIIGFSPYSLEYCVFATLFIAIVLAFLLSWVGLYQMNAIMRPIGRSDEILICIVTSFLFFLTIAFSLKASEAYSRLWLGTFGVTSFFTVVAVRVAIYRILRVLSQRSVIGQSMVVLGAGQQGQQFLDRLKRTKPYFTEVLGVYDRYPVATGGEVNGYPVLGDIEDLIAAARRAEVDDVVVAMPWNADREVIEAVERLKELPVNVYISSDLVGFQLAFRPNLGQFHELPMFEVVRRPISGWGSVLKSLEDYILASLALILLSPLLILVAIAIKLDSRGPVFFRQPRLGFNNRRFDIFKFRSMYHSETPENRVQQATKGDPRVTRVGQFIRATSIDELPQILNVLNGTMSLVGPRPHALSHNEEFARDVRGYFARHKVRPGITGWAQVNGLRGETDTSEKIRARVDHDVYYAENWSLLFDLRILIMTVVVVLFQKTAY